MSEILPRRSKLLMVILETFFGVFGVTRLYLRKYTSFAIKLSLPIIAVILSYFEQPATGSAAFFLMLAWFVWTLFDYLAVIMNAVTASEGIPESMGKPRTIWIAATDIYLAQIVAIVISLPFFAFVFLITAMQMLAMLSIMSLNLEELNNWVIDTFRWN